MLKSANGVQMFGDVARRKRYFYALLMILLMIGAAELLMEREIIFPEMAALTIGMWIVDKRVWRVSRIGMVVLMTLGAIAGVCIVRYSPFPLLANLMFAFAFAAICLTLFPCDSGTADFSLYVTRVIGNGELGLSGSRVYYVGYCCWRTMGYGENGVTGEDYLHVCECKLEGGFGTVGVFIDDGGSGCITSVYTENLYFILPPLIVTLRGVCQFKSRIS